MVGAAQLGRSATGIDLNPLATFVSKVKLTPLSHEQIEKLVRFLGTFRHAVVGEDPWPIPDLRIADKVFEPQILDTVLRLRGTIEAHALSDTAVRDFLLLGWLAILQNVGSYFKEGNGIKYRNKKRLKTGYTKRLEGVWQRERFGENQSEFVYSKFEEQLAKMISDIPQWENGAWNEQRAIEGSALDAAQLLENEQFDSIIFSPPYANRFDYFESLKVELWFGGFVNSYAELTSLRKRSVRSHLGAEIKRSASELAPLEQLIELMDRNSSSWRMGVPFALRGYFDDMYRTLLQCKALLQAGGSCYVVVGNSAYAGVIIPTDSLIAQLGLEAGFTSVRLVEVRHLTVAPQQRAKLRGFERYMRESIVVFK